MAVTSITELFEGRTGAWTCTEGRKVTRLFRVLTNNPYDGPNVAIGATGINRGDQYLPAGSDLNAEADGNAYCQSLSAAQEEGDPLGWIVTAEYGPYSVLWSGGGPTQNPLLQPIDVSWSERDQQLVADIDINGKAITNTAGDPFDPPIMVEDPRFVLTVVRNENQLNMATVINYRKAINSDQFAGYGPLMVRVVSILPKCLFHQDIGWYYQVTYTFECLSQWGKNAGATGTIAGQNGWRKTVINQGLRAISPSTGKLAHVTINGIPVTEPVLLDQSGYYKANNPNVPYYNVYQIYPELPFSAFNFDPIPLQGLRTGFMDGYGTQVISSQS